MNWRYRISLLFFAVMFLLIVARLFYWQVVRAEELASLGETQYGRIIELTPIRGEIKTSDGYALAANKISYLVFANPKEVENKELTALALSEMLHEDIATISALLSRDKFWVALKRGITEEERVEIEKKKLKGVGFEEQSVRFYPEASTAAKLLGFVGKNDEGEDTGYFGIEGYYDRQLRGKPGRAVQIHDALGRPILAKASERTGEVDGRNLTLHTDRAVQFLVEKKLREGIQKYGAQGGMVGIMDPKTGGMLALAAYPSFDQRHFNDYDGVLYKNAFISNMYEPGSTFKPLILAAALEEGVVTPDTRCTICDGPVQIGEYSIKTWNEKYYPQSTLTEVIQHSDNTGMVFIGRKLGLSKMLTYFQKYGLGELTGIDLQGETSPTIRPEDEWYPIDTATATFGQGISITAIELLSAFSAIANDGKRMEPHVVSQIETPEGKVIQVPPKVLNTPLSQKTTKVMTEILVNAVDKGEAKWAKPKGYRIAGKTGTAQIPVEGKYDPHNTIPSFIGYAPADNPKFLMLVVLDRPTTSIYGSETAAPIFFDIAKHLLSYYGIPPTEPVDAE